LQLKVLKDSLEHVTASTLVLRGVQLLYALSTPGESLAGNQGFVR